MSRATFLNCWWEANSGDNVHFENTAVGGNLVQDCLVFVGCSMGGPGNSNPPSNAFNNVVTATYNGANVQNVSLIGCVVANNINGDLFHLTGPAPQSAGDPGYNGIVLTGVQFNNMTPNIYGAYSTLILQSAMISVHGCFGFSHQNIQAGADGNKPAYFIAGNLRSGTLDASIRTNVPIAHFDATGADQAQVLAGKAVPSDNGGGDAPTANAPPGSIYMRNAGDGTGALYVKTSTTWVQVTVP